MSNILLIEDNEAIIMGLEYLFTNNGYNVRVARSAYQAKEILDNAKETEKYRTLIGAGDVWNIDIVILDVMLPDGDGFSLCRQIRQKFYFPIIMLTAKVEDMDKIMGLTVGADDYITKPFSLSVLRARVNTQLRKQASNHKNAPFHMDLFHFDFEAMTFYVADSKVELSKTEQKLLRLLVENRGRTMTRGDLVDRIWTDGAEYVDENALSVTIKRLRDKLGAQKYIKTVYGIGYSWVTKDE